MIVPSTYQREVVSDPVCGDITIDHDPSSGAMFIEFERFETNDGVVVPLFRVSLTTEHVAAWIERILSHECGRKCKRIGWDGSHKRLQAMLKLTATDTSLIYCAHQGANVILIRDGKVLKVPFCLTYTKGDLFGVLKETRPTEDATPSIQCFADFVRSLML